MTAGPWPPSQLNPKDAPTQLEAGYNVHTQPGVTCTFGLRGDSSVYSGGFFVCVPLPPVGVTGRGHPAATRGKPRPPALCLRAMGCGLRAPDLNEPMASRWLKQEARPSAGCRGPPPPAGASCALRGPNKVPLTHRPTSLCSAAGAAVTPAQRPPDPPLPPPLQTRLTLTL